MMRWGDVTKKKVSFGTTRQSPTTILETQPGPQSVISIMTGALRGGKQRKNRKMREVVPLSSSSSGVMF